jgi:uncharacterized membrane protein
MTTPPQADQVAAARPSAAVVAVAHVETIFNDVLMKVLGLGIFAAAGYFDFMEMKKAEPATVALSIFSGLAIFGAALACTDPIINLLTRLAAIVKPLLPAHWRGKDDA